MSKIFAFIFCFFVFIWTTFWSDDIKIISREEWWADEEYRFMDSVYWQEILDKRAKAETSEPSEASILKSQKENIANSILTYYFPEQNDLIDTISYENWRKLAWPISKTNTIKSIVIHHTHSEYDDSYTAIRSIYKYHALTNQRWDIGYNFLIWYNWEIFEWRAGGGYVVWAHDKRNNRSSLGIALIWDYDQKDISAKQYESLEKLISYLVDKYDINLLEKQAFFKWCISWDCVLPLDIEYMYPIIGHRDAWHTDCPWEKLYATIQDIRKKLTIKQAWFNVFKMEELLSKVSDTKLVNILLKLESAIDNSKSVNDKNILSHIKDLVLNIEKTKNFIISAFDNDSFDNQNKIKVKLSYPYDDHIDVSLNWKFKTDFTKKDDELRLAFISSPTQDKNKEYNLSFSLNWDVLFLNWRKVLDFRKTKFFRLVYTWDNFFSIDSWDRKPVWDSSWELNDNKFRGDIVLYKKDDKLIVVNDILLSDYLKWLWEVSNSENLEKIETIIILARTYARWYMTKDKKFPWEWYDASDDPNIFQKYLGYGLEIRSPNINKIVKKTQDIVITYNNKLIKPWYFSKSDWKTLSFYEYCSTNIRDEEFCKTESKKYPFLSSVADLWWEWEKAWHGVWVPWTWVKYFSEKWWTSSMIIKYFLKWVDIEKL